MAIKVLNTYNFEYLSELLCHFIYLYFDKFVDIISVESLKLEEYYHNKSYVELRFIVAFHFIKLLANIEEHIDNGII
jgi:hypothetical protein